MILTPAAATPPAAETPERFTLTATVSPARAVGLSGESVTRTEPAADAESAKVSRRTKTSKVDPNNFFIVFPPKRL